MRDETTAREGGEVEEEEREKRRGDEPWSVGRRKGDREKERERQRGGGSSNRAAVRLAEAMSPRGGGCSGGERGTREA